MPRDIYFISDTVALLLRKPFHRNALGQELPNQAVGIFIGAPLPGMVRSSEIEAGVNGFFNADVLIKLRTVIGSNGFEGIGITADEPDYASV